MSFITKLTDFLMPEEEEEIEVVEQEQEKKVVQTSARQNVRRVVNGASVYAQEAEVRPRLTVHTNPAPAKAESKLSMQIHVPKCFDDTRRIADDLKAGKAAVVNYSEVAAQEQIRICDFLNGVSYVLDGSVSRICDMMVLYVPAGVSISAMPMKYPAAKEA